MAKIVLFSGSFSPIHYGHIGMLKQAIHYLKADKGILILTPQNPLKETNPIDDNKRIQYIQWMIKNEPNIELSLIEFSLPKPNYTINTISYFKEVFINDSFYFLIGEDQANHFDQWKDYKKIFEKVKICVYRRGESSINNDQFIKIPGPKFDISSTQIRQGILFDTHPKILRDLIYNGVTSDDILNFYLSEKRKKHSQRVAVLAKKLAKHHKLDDNIAYSMGLFHDLLKETNYEVLKNYLSKNELKKPKFTWHGYAVSRFLKQHFKINNQDFLLAVKHHVLGTNKRPYSQILYIADKCEPGRNYDSSSLITLAKNNLNEGFKACKLSAKEYEKNR